MGRSLAMNFKRNGYLVIGFDIAPHLPVDFKVTVTNSLEELASALVTPIKMASQKYHWDIDLSQIVPVWRAGCIIRASLLRDITNAYRRDPTLPNLLLDDVFKDAVLSRQAAWRTVIQTAVGLGIPMLATSASLAYFDAYRSAVLPANLTQAQRDYFGAHTYRRVDKEGVFHTYWEE
jgi:6-phosphogluconate dehydrogenase